MAIPNRGSRKHTSQWRLCNRRCTSVRGRHILLRQLRTLAEEISLQLLNKKILSFFFPRLKTILVHEHLLVLAPIAPSLLGDIVVNLLAKLAIKGRLVQPFHLSAIL